MKKKFKREIMMTIVMVEVLLPLFAIGFLLKLYSVDISAGYGLGYVAGMGVFTLLTKQVERYNKRKEETK